MKTIRPLGIVAALAGLLPAPLALAASEHFEDPAAFAPMGDYVGRFSGPQKTYYTDTFPLLAAQVFNIEGNRYGVRFVPQLNARGEVYNEIDGQLRGDTLAFSGNGWEGEASNGVLSGKAKFEGQDLTFQLRKTEAKPANLGLKPPAGAIVLFDGSSLDAWQHMDGRPNTWRIVDGAMEIVSGSWNNGQNGRKGLGGDLRTKQNFKDVRLHIEFRYPVEPGKNGQGRGNSGVFLQGDQYEVQVLNSYGLDGDWRECGALYKHSAPFVHAALPPLQWQAYDIEYYAARYDASGKLKTLPAISVVHNDQMIHQMEEITHPTAHHIDGRKGTPPKEAGPIRLQDHSNAIQFRNIWAIDLEKNPQASHARPRSLDGK